MPGSWLDAQADRAGRTAGRDAALDRRLAARVEAAQAEAAAHVTPDRDLRMATGGGAGHGTVLTLTGVRVTRGTFTLGPIDLTVAAGERIALTGPNGAGKSTLIDLIRGRRRPDGGKVHAPEAPGHLDQRLTALPDDRTLAQEMRNRHPDMTPEQVRAALARFAFRNTAADRMAGTLSGGERLRAGLALALGGAEPPRLLLLDEPTNHLDLPATEALEAALRHHDGAMIVISHDPAFLAAIGLTRTLTLADGRLTDGLRTGQ